MVTRSTRLAVEAFALETETNQTRSTRVAVEAFALDPQEVTTDDGTLATRLAIEGFALETDSGQTRATRLGVEAFALQPDVPDPEYTRATRLGVEGFALETDSGQTRATRLAVEAFAIGPEQTTPDTVTAYFWDKKHDGWHPDTYTISQQPTASAIFDADDPGDRLVVFGCADGGLRIVDLDAETDDGVEIPSEVWIGPFGLGLPDAEARFSQLQVALSTAQGRAIFEWYAVDDPDADLTTLTLSGIGLLPTGLSEVFYTRARGLYVYLRIRNDGATSWAYESGSVMAAPAGRARQRTSLSGSS